MCRLAANRCALDLADAVCLLIAADSNTEKAPGVDALFEHGEWNVRFARRDSR